MLLAVVGDNGLGIFTSKEELANHKKFNRMVNIETMNFRTYEAAKRYAVYRFCERQGDNNPNLNAHSLPYNVYMFKGKAKNVKEDNSVDRKRMYTRIRREPEK